MGAEAGAKIALLDMDLRPVKMRMGIQFLLNNPEGVEEIKKKEIDITKERIEKILKAGANKDDLRQIAKVTGGTLITTMGDLRRRRPHRRRARTERVYEQRFADDECTIIEGGKGEPHTERDTASERRRPSGATRPLLEASAVVAGGGSVEVGLNAYLEAFAHSLASREQLAIAEFAQALMVIPKQLAVNAALDATDLVAKLKVHHVQSQKNEKEREQRFWGLDLMEGKCRNNITAGVLEPAPSKEKSFRFATEAAITILRIDDLIKINEKVDEEQQEMMRAKGMM
eukprot:gene28426-38_t